MEQVGTPATGRTSSEPTERFPVRLVVTPRGVAQAASLRQKLLWLSSLRIIMLLLLVFATAGFTAGLASSFLSQVLDMLTIFALVSLLPASLYFPAIFASRSLSWLSLVALVQVLHDCVFAAFLVTATGGTGSVFTFLFSFNIVVAGILLGRKGTNVCVSVCVVLLLVLALIETGTLPTPAMFSEVLLKSPAESVAYATGMNILGFISIGFLSSYLVEAVRRSDIQREHYRSNLEDLRQLHESILASIESGIITTRLDHRILHLNPAAQRLLGLDISSTRGHLLFEVLPEVKMPVLTGQHDFEMQKRTPDGQDKNLRVTVTPLLALTGEMVGRLLVVDDVTTLKRMEAQMKMDEQLTTIGKMAAVVAHEIRNPLATISASAQMLCMARSLREEDRHVAEIVVREADRLNNWIGELLDYARPRRGEMLPLDLTEVVQQAIEVLRADPSAARVTIDVQQEAGITIVGNVERLHRVFLNLGKNAIEAMDGAGLLMVRTWSEQDHQGRWAVVSFADSGCGISPEDIPRIFDAFYTTKPGGTGLGLAVVAQVVKEHGGTVSVTSEVGVRTEFQVRFPV